VCIAPSAARDGGSVPLTATLFAAAGRYLDVQPATAAAAARGAAGVGAAARAAAAAAADDHPPGVVFEWARPAHIQHVAPVSITVRIFVTSPFISPGSLRRLSLKPIELSHGVFVPHKYSQVPAENLRL
jgi:hypothetical protein